MGASRFRSIPERPRGIAEWEDLLVRVELGPRAFRIAIEGAPADRLARPGHVGGRSVADHLAHLARREAEAAEWLDAMRRGAAVTSSAAREEADPAGPGRRPDAARELSLFAERRSRNFAAVQRRGLEVWEWVTEHPAPGRFTAYQLLGYLAAHDGRHLAAVRAELRGAG